VSAKRSVLVTGASGFIGRRLVPALVAAGHAPTVTSARLDREGISDAPTDVVVHLAGLTYVPDSWRDPPRFYQTNVMGTLRVLDHCARQGSRMVFISSYVYGPPSRLPVTEDEPRRPANPYMHTKVLAEDCCTWYADQMGVESLIVRPFNVFGPGQDARFVIPTIISQLVDPAIAEVTVADALPRRDYLHVDDLVSLLVAAVGSTAVGAVNAGTGRSHSVQEVYDLLLEVSGRHKPLVQTGGQRRGEILDVVADIGRARSMLGWQPATDLREGLRTTFEAALAGSPS
jgi:nucleoside-diphosphate-sugar epimerase